ncbi:MAG TPA: carboxypeptidase regulatory-like domain-containing protein, partial [Blastocatellia bacterium]|nr:carboxypeptidase regulatory-like domain-containing protein [Blastocatellia bacterium]
MQTIVRYLFRALATSLLLLSVGIQAFAQNATGAIKGIVKDPNNAVVTTAVATATSKATGAVRKLNAGSDGTFVFESLLPGDYEVKVEAQGFSTQVQTLTVQVGGTTTADFSIAVGAASQTVDVTADAPVINTTDTVVGGIIGRDRVENLPLNGRSFLSIALLEPGVNVTYNATSGAGNPNSFFQVSIGGAPNSMTFITVDGARVNDRITGGTSQNFSAETVQEFQISTLGFDLSTGTVSAGAVNIVSRTGTNSFHGSTFLFFRDHNMAAFPGFKRPTDPTALSPFCVNPSSEACGRLQDPFFVRRQWGGTIGGPIKKDKLFFFGNYERNSQVGANVVTFSDPLVFGFNHVAQQPQDGDLIGARLDYTVSQKHTAFLRANIDSNDGIAGTGLESRWITSSNYAYQTQMGLTSVLKATLVNDFRFSYSYFRNRLRQPTLEECIEVSGDPSFCFGIDGPDISFFGGIRTGTNVNVSQDRHPRTFQFTDNVNWTKGSHRIRFGGNYEMQNGHGSWNQNSHGTYAAFSPATVEQRNPAIYAALPASLKTGYTGPRPTFEELLQLPMNSNLTIGLGDPGQPAPYRYNEILTNHNIRFYGQDAWQVFKGFTLNYGLGWSFESQTFYYDLPDLPAYLKPLIGDDLRGPQKQYKNFDPALGFAWALGDDQKTVFRSSVSLHHISGNVGFYALNQRILFGPAGNGLQPVNSAALQNPENPVPCSQVPNTCLNFSSPTNFTVGDMLNYLPTATGLLQAGLPFKGTDLSVRGVELFKTVAGAQFLDAIYNSDSSRPPYTFQVDVGVQREVMRNLSVSV